MPSTFFGISIAASGMNAYQAGLRTTAHNVANTNTKGYTRQSVIRQAKDAISLRTAYGMMGAGVNVMDIVSSRDQYYDFKYRASNAVYGRYATLSHYMSGIEDELYVADPDTGELNNALNDFFATLSSLSRDVSDVTVRAETTGYAESIAKYINALGKNLQSMQQEINEEIKNGVDRINSYARQIASLTKQINTLETYGSTANDLRDQRAVLLDELSEWVDIAIVEEPPADGNGVNQFIVSISGGGILVDTNVANQILVEDSATKDNQNDASGLYDLVWNTGQAFSSHNPILGGNLQALFELRDGNNGENFRAAMTQYTENDAKYGGKSTITLKSDSKSSENAHDLSKLNIPETNGKLDVANYEFEYESFSVTVGADGTYTYTFVLKDELTTGTMNHLQGALDSGNNQANVGDAISYRGIPYYMAQINEFARTLSASFNQIQNNGYDLYGNLGRDLFIATGNLSGEEFDMTEFIYNKQDDYYYLNGCKVMDSSRQAEMLAAGYTFQEIDGEPGYSQMLDAEGNVVEKVYIPNNDTEIFTFDSLAKTGIPTSYYSITALNFSAADEMIRDGSLLALASQNPTTVTGPSEHYNLDKMLTLREDETMFKQGNPGSFLSVMVATVGVDGDKAGNYADNAENILLATEQRRMSKSGVDEDEEGQNMIIFQNLLHYQYRVLSIMNEVLNKLINETAI